MSMFPGANTRVYRCLCYFGESRTGELTALIQKGCPLHDTVKAARIEHKCQRCGNPIQVGQPHTLVAVLMDGEFYTEKRHTSYRDCGIEPDPYEGYGEWE